MGVELGGRSGSSRGARPLCLSSLDLDAAPRLSGRCRFGPRPLCPCRADQAQGVDSRGVGRPLFCVDPEDGRLASTGSAAPSTPERRRGRAYSRPGGCPRTGSFFWGVDMENPHLDGAGFQGTSPAGSLRFDRKAVVVGPGTGRAVATKKGGTGQFTSVTLRIT